MIGRLLGDKHLGEIIRSSGIAFTIKAFGSLLSLFLSLLLARKLGAEGAGTYFLAFTIVTLIASVARLGMDGVLVRFMAICWENRDLNSISHLARSAFGLSLVSALSASLILYLLVPWLCETVFAKPGLSGPLAIMSFGVLFYSWTLIMVQLLTGIRRIRDAQVLEVLLIPGMIIAGVWLLADSRGVQGVAISFLIATIVSAIIGFMLTSNLWRPVPVGEPHIGRPALLRASIPLLGATSVNMLTTAAAPLFLGRFGSLGDVAIYIAASKAAFITAILLASVSSISTPKFAALYARGQRKQLEHTVRQVNMVLTLLAAPILVGYLVFSSEIMSLFGSDFAAGAPILMILAVGQFVSLTSGSVGQLLIASGHERACLRIMITISIMNILLNIMLVPTIGVYGAAVATAATMIGKNLYGVVMAKRLLGISVSRLLPLGNTQPHNA